MEPEITYRGAVYPWHCDHVGHMNVMWYVGKFDEATWNLFHRVGTCPFPDSIVAQARQWQAEPGILAA